MIWDCWTSDSDVDMRSLLRYQPVSHVVILCLWENVSINWVWVQTVIAYEPNRIAWEECAILPLWEQRSRDPNVSKEMAFWQRYRNVFSYGFGGLCTFHLFHQSVFSSKYKLNLEPEPNFCIWLYDMQLAVCKHWQNCAENRGDAQDSRMRGWMRGPKVKVCFSVSWRTQWSADVSKRAPITTD